MLSPAALFTSLEPATAATTGRRRGTVLVVEDEDSLADLLTHLLRRLNLQMLHAAEGMQALQLYGDHRASIDMAFVDCHLPDMGGGDLCATLRELSPGLPLLLTSGRDQRALQVALAAGGPTDFLPKPYMPGEVIRRITALLPVA